MPWFRRKKRQQHDDATAPVAVEIPPPAEPAVAIEEPAAPPEETAATAPKKRRRGSRGGRGRKKPGAAGVGTVEENEADAEGAAEVKPAAKAQTARTGERNRRKTGQSSQGERRRRQAPRRAPLPAAKRELLISVDVGEQRVAILEDDKVAEVYLERPERRSIAGNIYLGVVDNVLPGMEAAFVEIGLEKNGFLYVDEIVVPELEGKRHGKKIQDLISRGEKILVQAVKDPMKTKGARLTTEISLPGRFLVFVPNGEGLGVSRRLEDSERQRLKEILKEIAPSDGGVIVRTAAEGASAEDIERDLVFLQRLWKTIQAKAKSAKAPTLVYQEAELPLRIVRDLFAGDFVAAYVDNDRAHKRIVGYLKKTSPHMVERVHRDKEREGLFERFGVEKEISSTLERRVDLPSGGYLIFDYAEAFTVIDVNTGRFVGSRSKSSTQRLEDTIVKNNLEAVKEVVRQLRLRDIGGIIVIDFIDMANPKNRQAVEEALRQELERDRTKTYVVEISPLGLVEMTRQNVTDGPREVMTRKCPTCAGDGIVVSDATTAMIVERKLRTLAAATAGSRVVQAYRIAVHPRTLALLAGPGGSRLAALEEATKRRFYLVPAEGHAHGDHFDVLAEGKLAELAPASELVEGAELELKLAEIGLHDVTSASVKVDGVDVVVAEAAKLVGKKATVRIGRVLEGQAYATLVGADDDSEAITFESEAEKPTRAPAKRKSTEATVGADEEPVSDGDDATDVEDLTEEDEPQADADAGDGESTTPRKRTRRGSRGGRRRKKKPAVDGETEAPAEAGDDEGSAEGDEDGEEPGETKPATAARPRPSRRSAPRIHVPDDGLSPRPARGRRTTAEPGVESTVGEPGDGEVEVDAEVAAELGATENGDGDGSAESPARKKTRRGSRGGRNRKKRPTSAVDGEDGAEGAKVAEAVPDAEPGAEPPALRPPKPRARATAKPATGEGEPVTAPAGDGGYVPMSEWIDDFDARRS
ncbi:MAG: Rne/Rng family ribonuclease [Gaiellales bacterium]